MPFLFVQIAPYGNWMGNSNENYPILRRQQEQVSKSVADAYMASIFDIGNVYDIHLQNKRNVRERLALLAKNMSMAAVNYWQMLPRLIRWQRKETLWQIRL